MNLLGHKHSILSLLCNRKSFPLVISNNHSPLLTVDSEALHSYWKFQFIYWNNIYVTVLPGEIIFFFYRIKTYKISKPKLLNLVSENISVVDC